VQRHSQIRWITGLALHVALPTLLLPGELFTQWTYYHEKQQLGRRSRSKQLHTIHTPTLIYLPAAAACFALSASASFALSAAAAAAAFASSGARLSASFTASTLARSSFLRCTSCSLLFRASLSAATFSSACCLAITPAPAAPFHVFVPPLLLVLLVAT